MDIVTVGISLAVSLLGSVVGSFITFRLQFERFQSMDQEREKHWSEWRDRISEDVEQLKKHYNLASGMATMQSEVDRLRNSSHRQSSKVQWAVTAVEILLRRADIDIPAPRDESE